jgi:hypothetical protein
VTMRTQIGPNGELFVSVTSAMGLVKQLLDEPPDYYGPAALAKVHQLEGTACHAVCLDYLAHKAGWLPDATVPAWPEEHGDQERWGQVLNAAVNSFREFVEQYEVEPIAIEQEAFSQAYALVGHLDLLCWMNRKGRRVKAVVDLKFVHSLLYSHRLQVRCYGKLDQFKDAQIGGLYHADRTTGTWKFVEVNLQEDLKDVAAVGYAAHLYRWADMKRG